MFHHVSFLLELIIIMMMVMMVMMMMVMMVMMVTIPQNFGSFYLKALQIISTGNLL